jgi:acyl-coenzyme A synthetase/AMP-(fatty) acid ligase
MKPYPGYFFFGDGAARDSDGYLWIKGRVDGESHRPAGHLSFPPR